MNHCAAVYRCFLLFAWLVFGWQSLSAQQTGSLRALVVSSETGEPVVGAQITVYDEYNEIVYLNVTNLDGFALFRGLEVRSYRFQVRSLGFQTLQEEFEVQAGVRDVIRIRLTPSIDELEEVMVEAQRSNTAGNAGIERIQRDDLSRIPTAGLSGDLASYLSTIPGIVTTGDTGGDLFIRGGLPSQNIVFVDNIPVVKPFHISNIYSAFPEEILQTADVYAGGFGAEYSNATSAVLDIQLRPGNLVRPQGSVSLSPFIAAVSAEGPLVKDESSVLLSGRFSTIAQGSEWLSGRQQDLQFYDLTGRYTLNTDSFNCSITGILTSDQGSLNPARDINIGWTNEAAGIRCFGFDGSLTYPFEFTIGYSGFENFEEQAGARDSYSIVREGFIQFDQRFYALGSEWEIGLRPSVKYYRSRISSRFNISDSFEESLPILQAYAKVDINPSGVFSLQPGIASISSTNGGPTFEPRLRMSYRPERPARTELSLALGRYVQLADGFSDQRDAGNSFYIWRPSQREFPLQESLHGILEYRQGIGDYLTANAEAYIKKYNNLIVARWTPESQISTEPGLADGLSYGLDLNLRFRKQRADLMLNYGYMVVEYEAARDNLGAWVESEVIGFNPAHDQRHRFNAVVNYDFGIFKGAVRWEVSSGLPYTRVFGYDLFLDIVNQDPNVEPGVGRTLFSEPYGDRLPAYHRLDLSFRKDWQWSEKWTTTAELGAYNIYDRANIFLYDVNERTRVDQIAFIPYLSVKTSLN